MHVELDQRLFISASSLNITLNNAIEEALSKDFSILRLYYLHEGIIRYYQYDRHSILYGVGKNSDSWIKENKIEIMVFFDSVKSMTEFKLHI